MQWSERSPWVRLLVVLLVALGVSVALGIMAMTPGSLVVMICGWIYTIALTVEVHSGGRRDVAVGILFVGIPAFFAALAAGWMVDLSLHFHL